METESKQTCKESKENVNEVFFHSLFSTKRVKLCRLRNI